MKWDGKLIAHETGLIQSRESRVHGYQLRPGFIEDPGQPVDKLFIHGGIHTEKTFDSESGNVLCLAGVSAGRNDSRIVK